MPKLANSQSTGKVVSASGGHHHDWRLQLHKRPEMTMNRAIPAKHQDRIHVLLLTREADDPLDR